MTDQHRVQRVGLFRALPVAPGCAVRLEPVGLLVPEACACCGKAASTAVAATDVRGGSAGLIVDYCDLCHAHVSARATRVLASTIASALLAIAAAAALPAMAPRLPLMAVAGLALFMAALPLFGLGLGRVEAGHSARGRAVYLRGRSRIVCANRTFGEELARRNAAPYELVRWREPRFSLWAVLGPSLALAISPFSFDLVHPLVRVLNLTENRFELRADDGVRAWVEPSRREHPRAGVELRIAAGPRRFDVLDAAGQLLTSEIVEVSAGREHLFAPNSKGQCFWLESRAYGQVPDASESLLPLRGPARFWVLPRAVDSWFLPNPELGPADTRSTGGVLTALRHAPCTRAPAGVGASSR